MKGLRFFWISCFAALALTACKSDDEDPITPLDIPVLTVSEKTTTSFVLIWKVIEGATGYVCEFDGEETKVSEAKIEYDELTAGETYTVKVKAVAQIPAADSEWASIDVTLNKEEEPMEPTDELAVPEVTVSEKTSTSFVLTWKAVEGATGYVYEFEGKETKTEKTEAEFTGLTPGKTYTVKVKAVSTETSVESDWSTVDVELTAEEPAEPLATPVLSLESKTTTSFVVTWAAVEGATGYVYEFGEEEVKTDKTQAEFSGLTPGETYSVRVKAVADDPVLESEWANTEVTLDQVVLEMMATVDGLQLTVGTKINDATFPYYFGYVDEAEYIASNNDPQAAFEKMLKNAADKEGENAFERLARYGETNVILTLSRYNTKYYVLCAGIDQTFAVTTKVEVQDVVTGDVPSSSNTFSFEDVELTSSVISIKLTPSNSDPYAWMLVKTAEIDGLEGEALTKYVENKLGDKDVPTANSEQILRYASGIQPQTGYTLLVFGWDRALTTEIFSHSVTTPETEKVPLKFTLDAYEEGGSIIGMVYPSDKRLPYYAGVISNEDYAIYINKFETYLTGLAEKAGMSVYEYYKSNYLTNISEEKYDDLEPGEYRFFAVELIFDDEQESVAFGTSTVYVYSLFIK